MIVVTGAAGFIGSGLLAYLNENEFYDLVVVDDFSRPDKMKNLENKKYSLKVDRKEFFDWLVKNEKYIEFIFHLGARTDTTEFNKQIFDELNLNYSKKIWSYCTEFQIPLIYASSAATYGDGKWGYSDDHALIPRLEPLNPYGQSKNEFDKWVLIQEKHPYYWKGFKFFNVYGPNEYHKGRMASVVFHAFNQYKAEGKIKLFRSHRKDIADGEQKRDFVYVKDVCDVLYHFMINRDTHFNGIYNLGTGRAESFNELARSLFEALEVTPHVEFVDTPEDIRDKYQYYTCADITKLRKAGYSKEFQTLRQGVMQYVKDYLVPGKYW